MASADSKHNMFQTFSTVMAVYHQYKTENRAHQRLAAILKECFFFSEGSHSGFWTHAVCVGACSFDHPPSSFSYSGWCQLGVRRGAGSLGNLVAKTMLRRNDAWRHVLPVVPYALATLRTASSQIEMAWIQREMRGSLVIDMEEWGVEPQCEVRDDEREVYDDGESCSQSKRQRSEGSRYFADQMKIHRLNHKFSCTARAKTDDLEQRSCEITLPFRGAFSGSLLMWGRVLVLRRCRLTCTEPLSIGGRLSTTPAW